VAIVIRRLTAPLALLVLAAACSGGGSASTAPTGSTAASVPTVATLPPHGTVKLSDGVIYTVVAPGSTLKLDNVALRIDNVRWEKSVSVPFKPLGTRIYAVFTVTVTNLSGGDTTLSPTQIWLRNEGNRPFLAAGQAAVPRQLVGATLPAGGNVTGTLVFPLPAKLAGGLLLYRLGDLPATAKHVGIARYP
jgi:hypothetical protein